MLRLRYTPHGNALIASALIASFLLAFVAVTNAGSAGAQQIPTLNIPGRHMVTVVNHGSGTMNFTGHIQLNLFNSPTANVLNQATAITSCTACETLAFALQINVVSSLTSAVTARNNVFAINKDCHQCMTEADSVQIWILSPQSNLTVPANVTAFVGQMNREFAILERQPGLTPSQAMSGINSILAQNSGLLQYLTTRFAQTTQTNTPS